MLRALPDGPDESVEQKNGWQTVEAGRGPTPQEM